MISLFRLFPLLEKHLPYVPLGEFPTPVEKIGRLGKDIGIEQLYIKRDDISGRIYGGNKIRKLEFLLGSAKQKGAQEVLTFGCAGSNHALATAVYANKSGLRSISMLLPQPNAHYVRRNLLMSYVNKAELHHYSNKSLLTIGTEYQLLRHKLRNGIAPQVIPSGGTTPLGTIGYVNAAFELREHINQGLIPEPDCLYVTLGTMGTAAGLLLGLLAAGLKTHLVQVRVVADFVANPEKFAALFRKTNDLLHSIDSSFPVVPLSTKELDIRKDFFGGQYAKYTREGMQAVKLMKDTEGYKLDGCYTGKTFACLVHDAKSGNLKNKTVLFWNTLNSRDFSDVIKAIDYHKLPRSFHSYFEEDVQQPDPDYAQND